MIARMTSPCLCGSIVRPGMRIAYDGEIRKVTMCPSCAPSATAPKLTGGIRIPVTVRGLDMLISALRLDGKLYGFSFRHAAADSWQAWARYTWDGGSWVVSKCAIDVDSPTWLTSEEVTAAIEAARASVKPSAA